MYFQGSPVHCAKSGLCLLWLCVTVPRDMPLVGPRWVSEILFVGSQWVPLSSSPDVALAESLMDREISPCLYLATYPFGKE